MWERERTSRYRYVPAWSWQWKEQVGSSVGFHSLHSPCSIQSPSASAGSDLATGSCGYVWTRIFYRHFVSRICLRNIDLHKSHRSRRNTEDAITRKNMQLFNGASCLVKIGEKSCGCGIFVFVLKPKKVSKRVRQFELEIYSIRNPMACDVEHVDTCLWLFTSSRVLSFFFNSILTRSNRSRTDHW